MDRRKELEKMKVLGELDALARGYGLDIDHMRKSEIIEAILEHESAQPEERVVKRRPPGKAANTKLKAMRVKAGLTQREVVEQTGINAQTYAQYEQGVKNFDSARLGVILNTCVALNCKLEDIIESKDILKTIEAYNQI